MNTAAKFINSYNFSLLILLPAFADIFLSKQEWYKFPINLVVGSLIWYTTAFIVGYVQHTARCKKGSAFAYASKIASTASTISNILYFLPPFTLFWVVLGQIPYLGYFTNGLILNAGFGLAGWFMKC